MAKRSKTVQGPLKGYRYRGTYGWIYIRATDDVDALRKAERSLSCTYDLPAVPDKLEEFEGSPFSAR